MLCVPAARVLTANVAVAMLSSVALPNSVEPSRKFTVPVGVPTVAETCAVKVTLLLNITVAALVWRVAVGTL